MQERLQKVLAGAGIGSRRACEEWIKEGRVKVNGQVVTELGVKVDPATDRILFDSKLVKEPSKRYYIVLNKPKDVVCTLHDPNAGRLVTDLVDLQSKPMLRPVGRLDSDSEGLIFLTDDGDFLYTLTHPKHHVPKTYRATVRGVPSPEALKKLALGVRLEDGVTKPAENVRVRKRFSEGAGSVGGSEVELTIHEGKNRQVRRMLAAVGHPVSKLVRISIGGVRLTGLPSGAWRHLTAEEIASFALKSSTDTKKKAPSKTAAKPAASAAEEKPASWPTEQPPSKRAKEPSSSSSPKPKLQSQLRTSSILPKKASTTD
ncbi:hypothetical protein CCAX7_39690 [Capsulimonas corticalis]|uniref:Pseudouridine synthase n=1 Tax=Capsulimonas corticalis TaxID=2219043 RepID=A0A402D3F3_9BACT|nr:pseudouridine synthase [Capsulimonas corticalis]BDI31918.1 hypothetical protein CCAX7_39690 [Capsulimonas corticalis]